jgi:hypothetical protein
VVFSKHNVTDVRRGENSGRHLDADFVALRLGDVGPVRVKDGRFASSFQAAVPAAADGVACFLQDPSTLQIFGGQSVDLIPR